MVDQPSGYTEEDVQLVAEMIEHPLRAIEGTTIRPADAKVQAAAILDALAAAGRLLPPDTYTEEEYQFGTEMRTVWVGPWVPVDPPKEQGHG